MRKLFIAAVVALSTALGAVGPVDAQVRIKPYAGQMKSPVLKGPRVQPVRPRFNVLPPSVAVRRAMSVVPQAKALGVKLRNQTYIVRLKSGGTIRQVGVDSVTGDVTSID